MHARPYLLLALLALVWGVHWSITKIGLDYLPPYTYGALRAGIGLGTMLAIMAGSRPDRLRLPPREDWPVVLSVGLGQIAAGILLMNLALQSVAPGRSAILVYTMPLWVALMQVNALRAVGGMGRQLGGLALGLTGIVLLINPLSIDWGSSGQVLGTIELLTSAAMWAATTIHIRAHHWHATPMELEPWQLLVGFVPLLVAAVAFDAGQPIDVEPISIFAVLYSGILATALAFWLSQSISRALSPLAATMGFLAVPVVGLVSSFLLVGEPLGPLDAAGIALTFAGILVVSTRRAPGEERLVEEMAPVGSVDAA
jgi:drug/metabolite transporter (DMT)-like permease